MNIQNSSLTDRDRNAIRKIMKMWGEIEVSLSLNKGCINDDEMKTLGYTVSKQGYFGMSLIKDELKFPIYYLSDSRYHLSNGFYFGNENKFCAFSYIDNMIADIVAQGFNPDYKRSKELQDISDLIVGKINETKNIVLDSRCFLLGNTLRRQGYFVSYDGYSVCSFTKDGINYSAEAAGNRVWRLRDTFSVYIADGIISDGFSMSVISDYPESVLGNITKLGRRLTEMDLLSEYTKFRVRTFSDKTLTTIKWFDDFETAKKYAYDYAVNLAEKVDPRCREWAHNPPLDWSKRDDYLACYVWYLYNGNYPRLVFVQGEKD